ncbi:unnamed protein product [Tetraodon nigroviridis]|uniref:(spotted green pufferfish) hypothetical protein n=1 Tax=Tetraodon nigroviridis TaxID=99883 RepID=Q4RLE0_TETNG|nr:unnamed protein product [Tetraodon nigroviridis]
MYGGGPDLGRAQRESSTNRARWRESMPEGDRWRDDETELQRDDKGNGFLADDEAEGGEESTWNPEKTPLSFTPHVRIVHPSSKEPPEGSEVFLKKDEEEEQQRKPDSAAQFYPDWAEEESRRNLCQQLCGEKVKASLAMVASAIIFPLLVWGGYALLPFDPPVVLSSPLRVMYTLRCSFFATIPILLGMVVLGGGQVTLRHRGAAL